MKGGGKCKSKSIAFTVNGLRCMPYNLSYARSIAMGEDVAEHRGIPTEPSAVSVRKQLDRILKAPLFAVLPVSAGFCGIL